MTPRPLISTHSVSRRNHESRGLWPKTTTANSQNFGTKVGRLFGRVGRIPQAPPPPDPRIATGRETTGANRKTAKAANSQYLLGPSFPFATHTAKRSKVHRVFCTCTAATNETHSPSRHRSAPALGSCFLGVLFWFLILGPWSLGGFRIRTVVPACLEPAEAPPIQTAREGKTPDTLTGRFHPPTHKAVDTPLESCPRRSLAFFIFRIVETSSSRPSRGVSDD